MPEKKQKTAKKAENKKMRFYETWTFLILLCLVLPILLRSLWYAPFHIPSGSMKPTLLIGDYIFVSKSAYGYSRYSFPLGIRFFESRVFDKKPERGDVIVFRQPPNPRVDFIKRLVGLPGDKIQVKAGVLYINGKQVPRSRTDDFIEEDEDGSLRRYKRYIETLPNGVSYPVLDERQNGGLDNTPVFTVPDEHYFFMGDNRDNSADSRTNTVGYVPSENLVGKAELIFISTSSRLWKIWEWFTSMRTERFVMTLKEAQK